MYGLLYVIGRSLPAPIGFDLTNVYDRDWEVLVVLDGCRADLMREVAADFPWFEYSGEIWSVGSTSEEWMEYTFLEEFREEIAGTAYVTGNPHSKFMVDHSIFDGVVEVWRDAWDGEIGTIRARPVTDTAIRLMREDPPDRVIVHYMQPHFPVIPKGTYISSSGMDPSSTGNVRQDTVWEQLRAGDLNQAEVWQAYRINLEYVLDEVKLLVENIDADRVVLTSDHGNAMGEHGFYGHDGYLPLSCVRSVPWCETSATDRHEHAPRSYTSTETTTVEERLATLGYRPK